MMLLYAPHVVTVCSQTLYQEPHPAQLQAEEDLTGSTVAHATLTVTCASVNSAVMLVAAVDVMTLD